MTEDQKRFDAELRRDERKWVVRRRIAVTAFICNVLIAFCYMLMPLFITQEQSMILSQFNPIIISIVGFFSSIDMLYIGAATYSDSVTKTSIK